MLPDEGRIGERFATDSTKVNLAEVIVFPDLVYILLGFQLVLVNHVVYQCLFKGFKMHGTTSASNSNFVNFME